MNLTRNTAKLIKYLSSAESTVMRVDGWLTATVGAFRDTTGVTTLSGSSASFQTVHFPVPKDEKVMFLVNWGCTELDSTGVGNSLEVTAGGWRSGLGSYRMRLFNTSSATTGSLYKQWLLGPFESAQFQSEATSTGGGCEIGEPSIRFHLSTAISTAAFSSEHLNHVGIAPLRLPDVTYAT